MAGRVDNRPYGGPRAGRYGESLYGRWPFTPVQPCDPAWTPQAPCTPAWTPQAPGTPVWTDKPVCGA